MILVTASEAKALDLTVRERLGVSEQELIGQAGFAAAMVALESFGPFEGRLVLAACGKGHNAADGLVAARHLAATGAKVSLWLAFPEAEMAPEARAALADAREAGAGVLSAKDAPAALLRAALVIDALVGTGARLPLSGALGAMAAQIRKSGVPVLAMDLPSGLDADSGLAEGPHIKAVRTVSFMAAKQGLCMGAGPALTGALSVAPLGAEEAWAKASAWLFDEASARMALPARATDTHKRKAELLIVAGSKDYLGAALLCARAAYRGGAGLVRLALPEALAPFAQSALPEAVIAGLPADGALGEMHLEALLALAASADAAVVGPGLGRRPETLALVRELWQRLPMAALFDADALAALDFSQAGGGERVLSPHEGEIKGLMGEKILGAGRVAAVRALAVRSGAVALLKGPATLVARPDGQLSVDPEGTSVLATAGTGDVLSGLIGALLAQGAGAHAAAGLGVWAHGRAGRLWSASNAGRGLMASDLCELLPKALAQAGA